MKDEQDCKVCYKIICRQCQWEASNDDIVRILKREIIACPGCGWSPD